MKHLHAVRVAFGSGLTVATRASAAANGTKNQSRGEVLADGLVLYPLVHRARTYMLGLDTLTEGEPKTRGDSRQDTR